MNNVLVNCFVVFFRSSLVLVLLLLGNTMFSQNENDNLSATGSPEAKNFGSGSGISSVDTQKGTQNSSIPIHNYKGRELDLPMSLSYVSTGIKVNQVASNVGLGWNLNVGGRITRIVNNVADDIHLTNYSTQCYDVPYEDRFCPYCNNNDYYKVNVLGFEDIFRFKRNSIIQIVSQLDPKRVIQYNYIANQASEIVITAEDGTKFYFQPDLINETVNTTGSCGTTQSTSWMVTKIVSKNGLDEYLFTYQSFEWSSVIINNGDGYTGHIIPSNYFLKQQMVTEIKHNGKKIIGFNYANRDDLTFVGGNGNALAEIEFYNFEATSLYKKVGFAYTYFGNELSTNFMEKRLKLDNLTFYGVNSTDAIHGDVYSFIYHGLATDMPSITSYAQDYMGLYNGKDDNPNLIPDGSFNNSGSIATFGGDNRNFNLEKSLTGTLEKIIYPNKGFIFFEYEQNAFQSDYYDYTSPAYDSNVDVTTEVNVVDRESELGGSCGYEEQYSNWNPIMEWMSYINYPYHNNNEFPNFWTKHCRNIRTVLIRIAEPIDAFIATSGLGVYLIQKIASCDENNDETNVCGSISTSDNAIFNPCIIPTEQLYYDGINSSQNNSYVSRGLTTRFNDPTPNPIPIHLESGAYQITLWNYPNVYEDGIDPSEKAGIRLFKYINVPTLVHHNPVFHDLDQASNLVDGFRIKSVSNYSKIGVLASKKAYKYFNGHKSDFIRNIFEYYELHSHEPTKRVLSRGYTNSEIIHYENVREYQLDKNNFDKGYIDYFYDLLLDDEASLYQPPLPVYNCPFQYTNYSHSPVNSRFTGYSGNRLIGKSIYDKNGILLNHYDIEYGSIDFAVNSGYANEENIGDIGYDYERFFYTSQTHFKDYRSSFENITESLYGADCRIFQKSDTFDIQTYDYQHPYRENIVTGIHSALKGYTKFIYPPYVNTVPVPITQYLVSEVQHQSIQSNAPLETTTKYKYDSDNNRVETIAYTPGVLTPSSYQSTLYGYGNRFAVAQLSGVKYSDIKAIANRIDNITALSNVVISTANDNALRTELNKLRIDFPDALITTYTYNPVFGVTSMTDAKGYTIYYEYDVFGRLEFTKEKDPSGNFVILSENKYNSRPN